MPKMGLMLMKLLEFCQEVIILKCENYLTHPFVPLCSPQFPDYGMNTPKNLQLYDARSYI